MNHRFHRLLRATPVAALAVALAACGNRGSLYLPPPQAKTAPTAKISGSPKAPAPDQAAVPINHTTTQ